MYWKFSSSVFRMMWAAGVLASVSSITYPAISAFVSMHSDADKQGKDQEYIQDTYSDALDSNFRNCVTILVYIGCHFISQYCSTLLRFLGFVI
jgi:hypothetical protein